MSGSRRGFAKRVKGLFGFTPSKQSRHGADSRDMVESISHTEIEPVSFRKFELPVVQMQEEEEEEEYGASPSQYSSPVSSVERQQSSTPLSLIRDAEVQKEQEELSSAPDAIGSKWNANNRTEWNSSLPPGSSIQSNASMQQSASMAGFDNSKFRQYNSFGNSDTGQSGGGGGNGGGNRAGKSSNMAQSQSMPGFIEDYSTSSQHDTPKQQKSDVTINYPDQTETYQPSASMLDDLDEDLMDSILED